MPTMSCFVLLCVRCTLHDPLSRSDAYLSLCLECVKNRGLSLPAKWPWRRPCSRLVQCCCALGSRTCVILPLLGASLYRCIGSPSAPFFHSGQLRPHPSDGRLFGVLCFSVLDDMIQ